MRRITLTVVTTLAVLVLLFSYRTSRDQPTTAAAGAPAHVVTGGLPSIVSSAAGPDPARATAGRRPVTVPPVAGGKTASRSTAAAPITASKPAAPASATPRPAAAPPSTTKALSATVDGATVSTRYGDVQVEVVISDGRISDVQALQYPNQESRDQEINADALPQLRAQVLAAQSANIAGVGGATYTTEGYVGSLQSALDQVHFQ